MALNLSQIIIIIILKASNHFDISTSSTNRFDVLTQYETITADLIVLIFSYEKTPSINNVECKLQIYNEICIKKMS